MYRFLRIHGGLQRIILGKEDSRWPPYFTLLIGLALLFLTAIGYALSLRRPDVLLPSKTKGHETLGLFNDYRVQHCRA